MEPQMISKYPGGQDKSAIVDLFTKSGSNDLPVPAHVSSNVIEYSAEVPAMQIPIFIEPVAGNGYRSRGGEQFSLTAEGATREEVLAKLKEQLQARLRDGTELVSLEVPPSAHPLAQYIGMFKDDPLIDEWLQSVADYRKQVENDPDYR
jgi:hypothetical protein